MGTTVIGGMLAASAIAIFFIPAIFYFVEKISGAKRHNLAEPSAGTTVQEGD
jgi:HAE1 family hydrophobic/amphiphilic exporter-1